MQITGRNHLAVDPATAWAAFHDPAVLERALPGCHSMREVGPGRFAMSVTAGVAAIKGTYEGHATFSQEQEPESFVLGLSGSGGPGTVTADVHLRLSPADDGGTDLDWTADAVVGGAVGGVGQRMLSSVARRLANQFFTNIDRELAAGGAGTGSEVVAGMPSLAAAATGAPGEGPGSHPTAVHTPGPADWGPVGRTTDRSGQVTAMVAGAAIALAGVALGARLRRR